MKIEKLSGGKWGFDTPSGHMELSEDQMLANDVTWPWDYGKPTPWIIYDEGGPFVLVWADHLQDALDTAVDENQMDHLLISDEDVAKMTPDEEEDLARLGNASEPFDLTHVGYVELNAGDFPKELVARFAAVAAEGFEKLSGL